MNSLLQEVIRDRIPEHLLPGSDIVINAGFLEIRAPGSTTRIKTHVVMYRMHSLSKMLEYRIDASPGDVGVVKEMVDPVLKKVLCIHHTGRYGTCSVATFDQTGTLLGVTRRSVTM
jgi:hypothetical protein